MWNLIANYWGDVTSALGLAVSLVGFYYTYSAALAAKNAAQQARNDIRRSQTLVSIASAIKDFEELEHFFKLEAWEQLPPKIATLRRTVVALEAAHPEWDHKRKTMLQGIIYHLHCFKNDVEHFGNKPDIGQICKVANQQMDKLIALLEYVKLELREET